MDSPAAFIEGLLLGASLIIAIGAQNAFVLRQGLQRRYVFAVATTCTLCDIVLIAAGVAGLGTLVQKLTGVTPPPDAVNRARIAQAERVIERFSGDPRLSPETLADALAISRRTLYSLETAFPGGIGEQIRLARISAACRLLSDPEWAGATVETIARRSGFSSAQRLRRALASVDLVSLASSGRYLIQNVILLAAVGSGVVAGLSCQSLIVLSLLSFPTSVAASSTSQTLVIGSI